MRLPVLDSTTATRCILASTKGLANVSNDDHVMCSNRHLDKSSELNGNIGEYRPHVSFKDV